MIPAHLSVHYNLGSLGVCEKLSEWVQTLPGPAKLLKLCTFCCADLLNTSVLMMGQFVHHESRNILNSVSSYVIQTFHISAQRLPPSPHIWAIVAMSINTFLVSLRIHEWSYRLELTTATSILLSVWQPRTYASLWFSPIGICLLEANLKVSLSAKIFIWHLNDLKPKLNIVSRSFPSSSKTLLFQLTEN